MRTIPTAGRGFGWTGLILCVWWAGPDVLGQGVGVTPYVTSGLSTPLFLTQPAGNDPRLYVVEKAGKIKTVLNGVVNPDPFLDISSIVSSGNDERGLLGLAFDPNYATNGRFYVNYIDKVSLNTTVARYKVIDPAAVTTVDSTNSTAEVILTIAQPNFSNHKSGWIGFRPGEAANNLYIATGDGGGSDDPNNNAQSLTNNLGKILRMNVAGTGPNGTGAATAAVGNPFINKAGNDEIWAYGLRNPFRNSFDRGNPSTGAGRGDFYIADVGQGDQEELNIETGPGVAERNYGWRVMEGPNRNPKAEYQSIPIPEGAVSPVFSYDHDNQRRGRASITGGYVYRGAARPHLQGTYFFGDYVNGTVGSLKSGQGSASFQDLTSMLMPGATGFGNDSITSFGEDAAGELYIIKGNGTIFQIVPEPTSAGALILGAAVLMFRRRNREC